jgi:hypothetical protein
MSRKRHAALFVVYSLACYRQLLRKLRRPILRRRTRVTNKTIRGLVKHGYLGPEDRENSTAVRQALNLFLWDELREQPKPKRAVTRGIERRARPGRGHEVGESQAHKQDQAQARER